MYYKMMISTEELKIFINKNISYLDNYILTNQNIYRTAMYTYNKYFICQITQKMFEDTKRQLRLDFIARMYIELDTGQYHNIAEAKIIK